MKLKGQDGSRAMVFFVLFCFLVCVCFFFFLSFLGPNMQHMEVPQAMCLIRAVASGLHQSHSNKGTEPCL